MSDDARPTEALDRVLQLSMLVATDLGRFEQTSGLTTARVHLLWVLGAQGPATQQTLAAALDVTPRNVTGLVDGLVASGHVTRESHPTDRRARVVTPTALGERCLRDLREGHVDLARRLFADVPPRRLAGFVTTLDQTITTLERLIAEDAAGTAGEAS